MHAPLLISTLAALLLFNAAPATAGWYSRSSTGRGGDAEMHFQDHKLRVDTPDQMSMIIDLGSGDVTLINHSKKVHAVATLDEIVKLRDEAKAQLKQQLPNMPPEVRAQVEKQLKEQDEAMKRPMKINKTARTEEIAGKKCTIYTFSGADGDGEACLTDKPGADVSQFRKDAQGLLKKMEAKGAGSNASSNAMLQLAPHGFAMRTKQSMAMGGQKIDVVTEVKEIRELAVPADKFVVPPGYEKKSLKEMAMMGPS